MRAGALRHRVFVRTPVKSVDAKLDTTFTFTDPTVASAPNAYASIEPLVGRELIVAKGIRADLSHKIRLRCDPSATPTQMDRMYWYNGREFEVYQLGPPVDMENRHIEVSIYAVRIR